MPSLRYVWKRLETRLKVLRIQRRTRGYVHSPVDTVAMAKAVRGMYEKNLLLQARPGLMADRLFTDAADDLVDLHLQRDHAESVDPKVCPWCGGLQQHLNRFRERWECNGCGHERPAPEKREATVDRSTWRSANITKALQASLLGQEWNVIFRNWGDDPLNQAYTVGIKRRDEEQSCFRGAWCRIPADLIPLSMPQVDVVRALMRAAIYMIRFAGRLVEGVEPGEVAVPLDILGL